jgi:hypothetical protein
MPMSCVKNLGRLSAQWSGSALRTQACFDVCRTIASARYQPSDGRTLWRAVTLGSDKVQVAGVLSIAARGDYPLTPETQQKMYPRREFFDETVAAFKRCIIGSTDAKGVEVTDRKVDHRHLFHTYLQASESTRRASLMLLVENSQLPIRLLDRSQPRMFFIWQRLLATSLTAIFIPTRSTSTRLTTMDMFDPCDWPPRDRDNFSFFMR